MRKTRQRAEQQALLSSSRLELMDLRGQLDRAYHVFNSSADPDAVEASIWEIRALQAKYSRALRSYKQYNEV